MKGRENIGKVKEKRESLEKNREEVFDYMTEERDEEEEKGTAEEMRRTEKGWDGQLD